MTNEQIGKTIHTVYKAEQMYTRLLQVINIMQEVKEISNVELNTRVHGNINVMMKALEKCGKVTHENRKEELITIEDYGFHGPLDAEGFEIEIGIKEPRFIEVQYKDKTITVENPEYEKHGTYGYYNKKIPVTRKYWHWEG